MRAAPVPVRKNTPGVVRRLKVGRRTLSLSVTPGVHDLDPYAPVFAARLPARAGTFLDLGCGAGTYALALAARGARVVATDLDRRAVACTLANVRANGLGDRVEGLVGSLFAPVRGRRFDGIVATLPQLPAPRPIDLPTRYGGKDGLDLLRALAREAPRHLVPGGRVFLLVTGWAGPRGVAALLEAEGFRVRTAARVERAFQPSEYDGYAPGLFAYLEAHDRARGGPAAFRRAGSWCYLAVTFLEARLGGRASSSSSRSPSSSSG